MLRINSPLSAELERLVTRTIGCAINVHKTLGPGFIEGVYRPRTSTSTTCHLR